MDITLYNNIPASMLENEYILLQDLYLRGDDVQKLSVIQALPQLLQLDANATLTRIVPKIQQELPKSSCEFHVATSKIFKLLIEKQLPLNLTGAVLQGTESKDPVVSNAWIETLLAVIHILPIDQIKSNVLPVALAKSQPSSPVYCRVASCKIFGKCSSHPKMESICVKTLILPAVTSLCQDCFQDVRATMCTQLPSIAQGLGDNLLKSSLLPSLVELASDDNPAVRSAAVASAVLVTPFLNKETKIQTIVPLIKKMVQKPPTTVGDTTYPTIAKEYGKLVISLQADLEISDCVWILQFFKTLASRGQTVRPNKDNVEVTHEVLCRNHCAYNLPAVTVFTVARIPNQLDLWQAIFSGLANDSCYVVRKTTAASIHEVAKILGAQSKRIKDDFVKLLRDDAEEVLQMLVPNVGTTLEIFGSSGVISRDVQVPAALELARALLKCQMELAKSFNWRIKTNYLQQLEHLPNCMPSDFIHQHFSPAVLNCVLEARPKPLRSQATRTLLIFLRYNLKEIQRKWIRDNLITHLCFSKSCYTRHIFLLACRNAMDIFSNSYFKKYFFDSVLTLAEDPISNIRLGVIQLLPLLFKMLVLPEDKILQSRIDCVFSKLESLEKNKDVKEILKVNLKAIRTIGPGMNKQYLMEQKRREDEENKIFQGKNPTGGATMGGHNLSTAVASSNQAQNDTSIGSTRSRSVVTRPPSAPPRVSRPQSTTSTAQAPSDMSFLEHHFYIDAGVSLPREKIDIGVKELNSKFSEQIDLNLNLKELNCNDVLEIPTVSVENVDLEAMTETDLKKLETSTTNITDDVKVNLRKRNCTRDSKIVIPKQGEVQDRESSSVNMKYKRYSSTFPSSSCPSSSSAGATSLSRQRECLNRRSLNITATGDGSKIPVCLKKANADVKKIDLTLDNNNSPGVKKIKSNSATVKNYNSYSRIRPKSAFLMNYTNENRCTNPVPKIQKETKEADKGIVINANNTRMKTGSKSFDNTPKSSGLPILMRRTMSETRK